MADGTKQPLRHEIDLPLVIGDHAEDLVFQVTNISPAPVILGITWLEEHNPQIDWVTKTLTLPRPECREHRLTLMGMELYSLYSAKHSASERQDILTYLPPEYHDFADVFQESAANVLPPPRPGIDHAINLLPGQMPPLVQPYPEGYTFHLEQPLPKRL